jgi:hypothetical protein
MQAIALLAVTLALVLMSSVLVTGSSPAVAGTSSGGQRTDVTINVAALPLDNLCNGDVVVLSGEMRIVTVTRPTNNGGYTVTSTATARNLRGQRIAPPPPIGYRGDQTESSYTYYAPPPYPRTTRIIHWTKLVPQGKAPTMWLVVVFRYVILPTARSFPSPSPGPPAVGPPHRCPRG